MRAIRALDPTAFVFCGGEATLEVVGRLVYTVRQVGSAAPVFEYREAMPVTGEHGIPSLGSRPGEAVERLKGYVDSGRLEQTVVSADAPPAPAARVPVGSAGRHPSGERTIASARDVTLEPGDPLAHRALQALVRAEAAVRRRLAGRAERREFGGRLLRAGGAHHRRAARSSCARSAPLRLEQGKRHRGHQTLEPAASSASPAARGPPRGGA